MRTIGKHWPRSAPNGDYAAMCDYCGVQWRRSQLVRDASGLLACPDDQAGRDVVTLSQGNAEYAARQRQFGRQARDGANWNRPSTDVAPPFVPPNNPSPPPPPIPVIPPPPLYLWNNGGYWFDLPTSLVSSTASARALTPVGAPTVVSPAMGGNAAYKFNGINQYLSNATIAAIIQTGKQFTVALRLQSNASSFQAAWASGYEFTGATIRGEIASEVPVLNTVDGLGGNVDRTSDYQIRYDDVCVTWVYDGGGITKIYVNGVPTNTVNGTVPIPVTSPATLTTFAIGCHLLTTPNLPFNGLVKRAAVGDFTATDSQVLGLYNAWGPATDYTLPLASSPRFLWIGDSITQGSLTSSSAGYRYTMKNKLTALRYSLNSIGQYNQGAMPNNRHGSLGGSDLATISGNFSTALGGQSVKLVIFMGGTNNMAAGDANAAAAAYSSCLDAVWAQASALDPTVKIAVTTIINEQTGNPGQTTIAPFNALLPAIWSGKSYAAHLITWDAYATMGAWNGTDWTDTTHLNQVGSDKYFNNGLWPAISSYVASISPTS